MCEVNNCDSVFVGCFKATACQIFVITGIEAITINAGLPPPAWIFLRADTIFAVAKFTNLRDQLFILVIFWFAIATSKAGITNHAATAQAAFRRVTGACGACAATLRRCYASAILADVPIRATTCFCAWHITFNAQNWFIRPVAVVSNIWIPFSI